MTERIATPIGLFKAGKSGVGGEYRPMTPMGIRQDFFKRLPEGIIYGLAINASATAPKADSMIIDVIFDNKVTLNDPQLDHTIRQVTDYPIDVVKKGLVWFCPAEVPGYTTFSKVGKHTVTIKVAPRKAPVQGGSVVFVPPGTMKKVTTVVTTTIPAIYDPCTGALVANAHTVYSQTTADVPVDATVDYVGYSVTQDLGTRDFSPEAGGVTETFTFNIYPEDGPAIPYDEEE
jgi:hypothetical protein